MRQLFGNIPRHLANDKCSYHLAPKNVKRLATWIQGWATWFGYVSLLASIANVTILLLESLISLNVESYVEGGWHTSLLVIAMCLVQGLMNVVRFYRHPCLSAAW